MESRNPSSRGPRASTAASNAYGNTTYPANGPQDTAYGDPSQWGTGTPGSARTQVDQGRMTIDSVVQKTGITLGVVVLVAAATWFLTGDIDSAGPAERPLRHLDGRRPRRLRAGDGQHLQEGRQPRAGPRLRRAPGRLRRCVQQGARDDVRRPGHGAGWPGHRRRGRHHGRGCRNPRGVQVLQHPGRQPSSASGSSRPGWASWRSPCSTWSWASSATPSASTGSARWA